MSYIPDLHTIYYTRKPFKGWNPTMRGYFLPKKWDRSWYGPPKGRLTYTPLEDATFGQFAIYSCVIDGLDGSDVWALGGYNRVYQLRKGKKLMRSYPIKRIYRELGWVLR